jgi:mono/diheme cytochrome c family protein
LIQVNTWRPTVVENAQQSDRWTAGKSSAELPILAALIEIRASATARTKITGKEVAMRSLLLGVTALALAGGAVALLIPDAAGQGAKAPRQRATPPTSFREDVFPIFKGRCVECHQPGGQGYESSGLDLTTYEGLMKGTKFGAMVIPGDPDSSNLMWLLDWRASPQLRMPHGTKKLSTCDRDEIRRWIREGAHNN